MKSQNLFKRILYLGTILIAPALCDCGTYEVKKDYRSHENRPIRMRDYKGAEKALSDDEWFLVKQMAKDKMDEGFLSFYLVNTNMEEQTATPAPAEEVKQETQPSVTGEVTNNGVSIEAAVNSGDVAIPWYEKPGEAMMYAIDFVVRHLTLGDVDPKLRDNKWARMIGSGFVVYKGAEKLDDIAHNKGWIYQDEHFWEVDTWFRDKKTFEQIVPIPYKDPRTTRGGDSDNPPEDPTNYKPPSTSPPGSGGSGGSSTNTGGSSNGGSGGSSTNTGGSSSGGSGSRGGDSDNPPEDPTNYKPPSTSPPGSGGS